MEKTRSQNSLVQDSCLGLASNLLYDLQLHHPTLTKSLAQDLRTLKSRAKTEGLGFLMHALPRLGKALYRALETGTFCCPLGFQKKKGTVLPRFLGGLLTHIVDERTGKLLQKPSEIAVNDFAQVCFCFYKLDVPCSEKSNKKVIDNFVKVEEELSKLRIVTDEVMEELQDLVMRTLEDFDPLEIIPRHGPGAVATREKAEDKWIFKRKYEGIHAVYPYYEYFVPTRGTLLKSLQWYKALKPLDSGCAKVTLVPKDSRGPRLISMEPLEYQFIQQGLGRALSYHLEKVSPLTRGLVNFTDQRINQLLAEWNSVSKAYSTLDMKEASDRVSVQLVAKAFEKVPKVLKALIATRTTKTELPDGRVLPLRKFAPMGSALCFPVEAFVFWALATVLKRRMRIGGKIYVYGDDLIVPRELTPHLFEHFPIYGLMFNEDKCFTNGYFRESCGCDAFKGTIVTPLRLKKVIPWSKKQAAQVISSVQLSNAFYKKGYWQATKYLRMLLEFADVRTYVAPSINFGGLSYTSFITKGVITEGNVRFHKDEQRFEVKALCSVPTGRRKAETKAFGRLFENLTNRLVRQYTAPHAVALRMRWIHLYG